MKSEDFEPIIMQQLEHCKNVLCAKAKEYATDDRLHNFKTAAVLQECTPIEALAGMMSKHTVSVYDMCRTKDRQLMELWEEKITDHINYLLLLRALVAETEEGKNICSIT